ncbi:hypothetical protein SMJ63A_20307 [Stenotrophomonas geniculata]
MAPLVFSGGFSRGAILWIVSWFPRRTVPSMPVVTDGRSRRITLTEGRVAPLSPPRSRCSTSSADPFQAAAGCARRALKGLFPGRGRIGRAHFLT